MIGTLVTFALGYCAAVIFPVPGVSRAILDGWVKISDWVKNKISK